MKGEPKNYLVQYHQNPEPMPESWRKKWLHIKAATHTDAAVKGIEKHLPKLATAGILELYVIVTDGDFDPPAMVDGKMRTPRLVHGFTMRITPKK